MKDDFPRTFMRNFSHDSIIVGGKRGKRGKRGGLSIETRGQSEENCLVIGII